MAVDLNGLPRLGFGLMRLPTRGSRIDTACLERMVDAYLEAGFNYFDTAYMYCDGKSEEAARTALVQRYPRERFMLADKLPVWMMKDGLPGRDRIFNDQLRRTGAGYFDCYLLHSVEDGSNYESYERYGCFEWAAEKKRKGLIRHFGFSFHGTPELLERILRKHPEVEFVQIQLNYLDMENTVVQARRNYEVLRRYDKPILVMEPVKGGTLAQLPPKAAAPLRALRPAASIASWALRYAAGLPGVATVLSGMSDETQLKDNIGTLQAFEPLNAAELEAVAQTVRALERRPGVGCTACRYCCDDCPAGIPIPDVFRALSALRQYNDTERAEDFYARAVSGRAGRAGSCYHCGLCETVCPQHLPIIRLLEEAARRLESSDR